MTFVQKAKEMLYFKNRLLIPLYCIMWKHYIGCVEDNRLDCILVINRKIQKNRCTYK